MPFKKKFKLRPDETVEVTDPNASMPEIVMDTSEKYVEKMARNFILGTQNISKQRDVRQALETKVVARIGKKGKYLTDKLFELIEGEYVTRGAPGVDGQLKYYKVRPNLATIIYALDRVLGKPKAYTEISEEKKGIIVVEHIIKNLAAPRMEELVNE